MQCSVFEDAIGDVALTAGGGLRQLPGLSQTFENAALVLPFLHWLPVLFELDLSNAFRRMVFHAVS